MSTNPAEYLHSLKNIDLFESFSEEELTNFACEIEEVTLNPGETLFREGEPGRAMFILLSGSLKVWKESRFITMLRPVDYIGEMAIIEDMPRSATVQAMEGSQLLKISREDFQRYLSCQPESLVSMMKKLSQRIRRDTEVMAMEFEKASILIHDMRNLLSPFLFLEHLARDAAAEPHHRYIRFMQDARKNLAVLMDEALARMKVSSSPCYEQGFLSSLLEEMAASEFSIHPDLRERKVTVQIRRDLPPLPFSKLDIRRVITNLVLNAAQASPPGSCIEIEVDRNEREAVVHIKDQGEGIPKELQAKVFLPHFTTRPQGNGLGLASCRQIIAEKHGGAISFMPRPEGGTVFSFTLPLPASAKGDAAIS